MFRLLILCSLLAGCATMDERPIKVSTETRIITLERSWDARSKCHSMASVPPGWKIVACATLGAACTIYMQPDAGDDTLGHETRHCFDGDWHKRLVEARQ